MSETPALVAFDLDDTLYLERTYVQSGFEAVGRRLHERWGISGFASTAWSLFEEGVRGKVFDMALARMGAEALTAGTPELVRAYREHTPKLTLLPDAAEVLGFLRARCRVAIISDGPATSQRKKVEALGLHSLVNTIILTDEMGKGFSKPSPVPYREAAIASGNRGEACAYIGDNPAKDFAGARALGWRTVRVRRPGGLHFGVNGVPEQGADCEVRDLWGAVERLGFPLQREQARK